MSADSAGGRDSIVDWRQIRELDRIFLNLGGGPNCHPAPDYEGYVAVDLEPEGKWSVKHDLREPIPLEDGSVDRIHSEDFLEHIDEPSIARLLEEAYRLLKPGGLMRVGVPDYGNPKDRFCLLLGHDPRDRRHVTLTTYPLMKRLVADSPFERAAFYHYWDGDDFVQKPIDYSLGMIKRTPDNDPRSVRTGLRAKLKGAAEDGLFRASGGFRGSEQQLAARQGQPLHVTSLVMDLTKPKRGEPVCAVSPGAAKHGDPVCVVCSNLATNCVGRVLMLAELAAADHPVRVAGILRGDDEMWPPALELPLDIVSYRLKHAGQYPEVVRWLRRQMSGHKVLASKPLATSLGLAILAGARADTMVLDNDDWELGMRRSAGPHGRLEQLKELLHLGAINSFASTWALDGIAARIPHRMTSNSWLAERFGGVVLPHVRDTSFLDPARVDREAARRELDMQDRVWVGFVGTPRKHKGLDDLVDAIAAIRHEAGPGLLLAGIDESDPYGAELLARARAALAPARLRLLRPFPFGQLPRWVGATDIVCLPSRRDAAAHGQVPAKLFDAMAMAKPVVATDTNDIGSILNDAGLVIEPGDVVALRDALAKLSSDEELRRRLGERARARAVSSYSYAAGRRILAGVLAAVCPMPKR